MTIATVYYFSYPIFLMFISWGILGRVPGTILGLAVVMSLAAIFLVTGGDVQRRADAERLGMAIAAPLAFAFGLHVRKIEIAQHPVDAFVKHGPVECGTDRRKARGVHDAFDAGASGRIGNRSTWFAGRASSTACGRPLVSGPSRNASPSRASGRS